MSIILFPVITPDVCRRYVAEGRKQRNTLAAQIRKEINSRAGETPAVQGSGDIPVPEGEVVGSSRSPRWPGPRLLMFDSPAAGSGAGAGRAAKLTAEAGGGSFEGGAACR